MRKTSYGIALALTITLSLVPGSAFATLQEDQTPLSEEEIQSALAHGEVGPAPNEPAPAESGESSFVQNFSGETRFDTSSMQALSAYSSSEYVIVVADGGWPDALCATGLAGVLDCPILLTSGSSLSAQTADAIRKLGATRAVTLGGELVMSARVKGDLESLGLKVDRLAGETRQDTQMMVYEYGKRAPRGRTWSTDAVAFASGARFHDALSFSPVAYAERAPIFLTDASGNLNSAQKSALRGRAFASSVVLGGPIVTSSDTVSFAGSVSTSGKATVLAGDTRFDTSALVARWAVDSRGFKWDNAAFTTAELPYDALSGSVLQGRDRSVVLLVADGSSPTVTELASHKGSVSRIRFFGGYLSVSRGTRMSIMHALGHKYSDLAGYRVYIDAGHGQNDSNNGLWDPGAIGNGWREADLTADLARRVGNILTNKYGIACYVNDKGGYYKLRQADAEARDCTSLVSIHFNSGGGTGSESLRHSYHAAESSFDLQRSVHPGMISGVGLKDRGMKTQQVAVLSGKIPATLLEICFIDNSHDMATYNSKRDQVAESIAYAIANA